MNNLNIKDIPDGFPLEAISRAKSIDGSFIFGVPVYHQGQVAIVAYQFETMSLVSLGQLWHAIRPETLTQCTGIEIGGEMLFGGDILESDHFTERNGRKHYLRHYVEWSDKFHGWRARDIAGGEDGSPQLWVYLKNVGNPRIVGTIWD